MLRFGLSLSLFHCHPVHLFLPLRPSLFCSNPRFASLSLSLSLAILISITFSYIHHDPAIHVRFLSFVVYLSLSLSLVRFNSFRCRALSRQEGMIVPLFAPVLFRFVGFSFFLSSHDACALWELDASLRACDSQDERAKERESYGVFNSSCSSEAVEIGSGCLES